MRKEKLDCNGGYASIAVARRVKSLGLAITEGRVGRSTRRDEPDYVVFWILQGEHYGSSIGYTSWPDAENF